MLSNYLVTPVMGGTSKSFSFQLTKGGARSYTLAAFSATEMRTYVLLFLALPFYVKFVINLS